MRRDLLIAILLAVAAIPVGVALMAAPIYFDIPKPYLGLFFWGGLLAAGLLIGAAVFIAIKDEERAKSRGQKRPMLAIVGMIIFGAAFLGSAGWYFWPRTSVQPPAAVTQNAGPVPKIGSLELVAFAPLIQRKVSTGKTSVQPAVDLKNTNDFGIMLDVSLKGAVNTVSGYPLQVAFQTFMAPHETKKILYQRLEDIPVNENPDLGRPALLGGMDYDITYWAAENPKGVKRRTAKRVVFEMDAAFNRTPPKKGTIRQAAYPIKVSYSNEIEE